MNIEEAYELAVMGKRPEGAPEGIYEGLSEEEQAAAVRAGFLAAHVDTCGARQNTDEGWRRGPACGDGWLCDKAREIEELSGGAASA